MEGVLGKNAILFLLPSAWNRGGGGGLCAGQSRRPGLDGGPGQGEKREGGEANRSPSSPCAGVERGGPATVASSGGAAAEERGCGVAAWFVVVGVVLGGCSAVP